MASQAAAVLRVIGRKRKEKRLSSQHQQQLQLQIPLQLIAAHRKQSLYESDPVNLIASCYGPFSFKKWKGAPFNFFVFMLHNLHGKI